MKTTLLAAAAALTLGVGSAYAGDGEGPVPNTQFTEIPEVVAQAPGQHENWAVAGTQNRSGTAASVTQQHATSRG